MIKIIDEKGRLFGKINVIDFLVIIFLFSLMPMFYLGYKISRQSKKPIVEEPKVFTEVDLYCKFIKVNPTTLKQITVGDKEIDESGATIGELTWVGEGKPYEYKLVIGTKEPISREDLQLKEVLVRLKIKANIRESSLYYKDSQVILNSPFNFITSKYTIKAIPIRKDIVGTVRTVKVDLNITFKNLTDDTIKLIAIGDKELDREGNVIAEILDIGKIENNKLNIDLDGNNSINVEDKEKKQVGVKMKLKADMDEERSLYFNNERVRYNSLIQFKTDKYVVEGIIAQVIAKERWAQVRVKFSGILPEIAMLVKEENREKDSTGSILAILKRIIVDEPTKIQTLIVQDKEFIAISSPFQRDIIASLDLLCEERDIGLFFKDYPVKVGNNIVFTTDLYSLNGIITSLEFK